MNIDEKDLSTKQYQSKAHARVSRSDEDSRGSCGYQEAARERAQTPQCTDTAQAGAPLAARTVRYTFPKAARLRVRREFLALQRRGERRYSRNFIVITSPARTARPPPWGDSLTAIWQGGHTKSDKEKVARVFSNPADADIPTT